MREVLITAKTRKGKAACVGGLILEDNRFVRLLNPGNWDQHADTDLQVGEIWKIRFITRSEIEPPHVEDVIVLNKERVKSVPNLSAFLQAQDIPIWAGSPATLFGGTLGWTNNGSGYLNRETPLPGRSVGFWIPDQDLVYENPYYYYNESSTSQHPRRLRYVGFPDPIKVVNSGKLLRVSLARWWKPEEENVEERCYLQLSGWY